MGSCYISFDREFHCEFESAKIFFQKCNMTGQLPVKSQIIGFSRTVYINGPILALFIFKIFEEFFRGVLFCNMTPAGSNVKMTLFRLYYPSKQRKFHSHSESIIKNISKMKYDSFFRKFFYDIIELGLSIIGVALIE